MEFNSIITAVQSGKADLGLAGMTVTDERKQSVDFTDSYATGIQSVIVKEGSSIKSIDDLKGKKIGVQLATTGDIYAKDELWRRKRRKNTIKVLTQLWLLQAVRLMQ